MAASVTRFSLRKPSRGWNYSVAVARMRCFACLNQSMPEHKGLKRFYDPRCFTPESVRQDETIGWQSGSFFHGGAFHPIRYKELKTVLWRKGAGRRLLRLIVIAPTGYRLHQ